MSQSATKQSTMREAAKAAGVSVATISNYINGRFDMMSVKTRERVARSIDELNYRPQSSARNLRLGKRFTVGFLVVNNSPNFLEDSVSRHLLTGIQNAIYGGDYGLLCDATKTSDFETSYLLRNKVSDAFCIFASGSAEERNQFYDAVERLAVPTIVFQDKEAVGRRNVFVIRQDDYGGAFKIADVMIKSGAQDIVMLRQAITWPAVEERKRALRDRVEQERSHIDLTILRCHSTEYSGVADALTTYQNETGRYPSGIFAANDRMAISAIRHAQQSGFKVPDDVRVSGFNAFDIGYYTGPTLLSMKSPALEMGRLAGKAALEALRSSGFDHPEILLPLEIQRGESC